MALLLLLVRASQLENHSMHERLDDDRLHHVSVFGYNADCLIGVILTIATFYFLR